MPTIPPNNTSGLYGIDNGAVTINNDIVANAISANTIVATGNITGGNLLTPGQVSAAGNVTGNYFIGDGSLLTNINAGNIVGSYGNANVAQFLANYGSNTLSTTGNVTVGNILTDNYLYANGQPISFAGTYSNANVAAYLPTFTGNIAAGNGNITNDLFVGGTIYGTFSGNIAGNLVVPGANTEIIYNNAGNAGASSDFRFNSTTRVMLLNGTANVANIIVPQTGTIDVGNSRIQNVAEPISGTDAATKDYVDGTVSGDLFSITADGNTFGVAKLDNITFQGVANQTTVTIPATDTLEIGLANAISVAGNITGNYILGNGSQLTGLPATYGNANVATFLANFGANAISTTGNVTAGYFIGNGSLLTGLSGTYSNANVAAFLAAFGSNTISTSGNITSGNIIANGQFLTNLPGANVTGTVANATYALSANSATFAGTVTTNAQPNITSVGTLSSLSSTGNITGGNILTGGAVSATGNVTGNYILGDGSLLTNLPGGSYGNANVANYLPTFTGNVGAGNLVMTSTSGVAYVNNITGLAGAAITIAPDGTNDVHLDADTVRIGDNNTDATIATHGAGDLILRTNLGDASQGNIILRDGASGNIDIQTNGSGVVNITGTAGLRVTDGISATGNITGGNLLTTGVVSATGNISGNYFFGNGSQLTGITGSYGNANVSNFLANGFGSNNITTTGTIQAGTLSASGNVIGSTGLYGALVSVSGNVVAGNVSTTGLVSATGNVTGGNLRTAGVISATGNITGNYFFGNGAFLTGISSSVAGSNTQVQFNDSGAFGASANLTFNKATQELQTDRINLVGGNVNFDPPSGTAGPRYITLTTDSGQPFYGVRIGPGATAANIPGAARDTVAIGRNAGNDNQGDNAIAIGQAAGNLNSGAYSVAIGTVAGANAQGQEAVAIGHEAGRENQSTLAVAIGSYAGYNNQGARSIAIGQLAGNNAQGATAIAIGYGAGQNNQPTNSIILNANGTTILDATNSGFYVMPVRNDTGNTTNAVYYNTTTKELTYTTSGGGYGNANVATFLANFGSNSISTSGNVTAGYFLGNGSQLTGITGGANTQLQFNDGGSFAGNANVTFNKATGNLAAGNLVFLTSNVNATNGVYQNWLRPANNYAANTATSSLMQSGRILIGDGLGNTWGGGGQGDFGVTYEQFTNYRSTNLGVAQRYTKTDNGVPSSGVALVHQIDVSGNVGASNANSRIVGFASTLFPGGNNGSGNLVNSNPLMMRAQTAFINFGQQNANFTSNEINVTACSSTQSGISMAAGNSVVTHHIGFFDVTNNSSGNANAITNHYGISFSLSGNTTIKNWHGVHLQNGSGNGWGTSTLPADSYRFLNNQDWRSSSVVGPVESSLDRVYTIGTTTGNVTINWPNGTTQYLKPTGNVTLSYANATVNSNGNLLHTVNLIVEQGTTAYTVTLPTANANILYASGNSTVPSTANAVTFINVAAGNINGVTKYMTSIGPEYT